MLWPLLEPLLDSTKSLGRLLFAFEGGVVVMNGWMTNVLGFFSNGAKGWLVGEIPSTRIKWPTEFEMPKEMDSVSDNAIWPVGTLGLCSSWQTIFLEGLIIGLVALLLVRFVLFELGLVFSEETEADLEFLFDLLPEWLPGVLGLPAGTLWFGTMDKLIGSGPVTTDT